MSEIIPNGDIELYRNIPLDREYNHTWYFTSANGQLSKMRQYLSLQYSTFTSMSYMRSGKNEIKIECAIANLQDVNYMSFINKTQFENRRYFAFVDDIEYINNETTKLHYRIDPIQTYFFDYDILPCFVEREHAASDGLFENVIPEDFKNMELVVNHIDDSLIFNTKFSGSQYNDFICVLTRPNDYSTFDIQQFLRNNYPIHTATPYPIFVSPVLLFDTPPVDPAVDSYTWDNTLLNALSFEKAIRKLTEKNWEIFNIYIVPGDLHHLTQYNSQVDNSGQYTTDKKFSLKSYFTDGSKTYTPKNKKLYISPFKTFSIHSPIDGITDCDIQKLYVGAYTPSDPDVFAEFDVNVCLFEVPQACGYITLKGYNSEPYNLRQITSIKRQHLSSLSYTAPFNIDSYSRFLAQSAQAIGFHAVVKGFSVIPHSLQTIQFSNLISGRMKGVTPSVAGLGAVASGLNAVADIGSSLINAKNATDYQQGSFDVDIVTSQTRSFGAYLIEYNIRPEQAKIVDDFFTMYGYATKTIKQPNRNARISFTYTKTVNCQIEPKNKGMQNSAVEEIQEIYNHGITFWHSDKTIGDYTVANDPNGIIGG